jgi:hypothetical protein
MRRLDVGGSVGGGTSVGRPGPGLLLGRLLGIPLRIGSRSGPFVPAHTIRTVHPGVQDGEVRRAQVLPRRVVVGTTAAEETAVAFADKRQAHVLSICELRPFGDVGRGEDHS